MKIFSFPVAAFVAFLSSYVVIAQNLPEFLWAPRKSSDLKRSDHSANLIGDRIFLVGGCTSNMVLDGSYYECGSYLNPSVTARMEIYNPRTDEYENGPDAPRKRYRHGAAVLGSKLYLIGGVGDQSQILKQVDVYDTVSKTWSTLAGEFTNATQDGAAFTWKNEIYFNGGYDDSYTPQAATYKLDIASGVFTQVSNMNLVVPRGDHSIAVVKDTVYVFGGFSSNFDDPLEDLEVFNGAKFIRDDDPLSLGRGDGSVAVTEDNYIFVFGGETKFYFSGTSTVSRPSKVIEMFDQTEDSWFTVGSLRQERFRAPAVGYKSSVLVFGGQGALVGEPYTPESFFPLVSSLDEFRKTADVDLSTRFSIQGSGTTNPSKYLWNLISYFKVGAMVDLKISYRAIGSGDGIKEFIGNNKSETLVDFACADFPFNANNYNKLKNAGVRFLQLPFALGTVSVFVNFGDNDEFALLLDGCQIARLFKGEYSTWDDPDLQVNNPGLAAVVPSRNLPVRIVARSDSSSSTLALSSYLKSACPSVWSESPATLASVAGFNPTINVQGSARMFENVRDVVGSVGYGESGHGLDAGLIEILMKNKNGKSVSSQTADISASVKSSFPTVTSIFPVDPFASFENVTFIDLPGDTAFPIILASYIFIREDQIDISSDGALLKAFAEFLFSTKGQDMLHQFKLVKIVDYMGPYARSALSLLKFAPVIPVFVHESSDTTDSSSGLSLYGISGKRNSFERASISDLNVALSYVKEDMNDIDEEFVGILNDMDDLSDTLKAENVDLRNQVQSLARQVLELKTKVEQQQGLSTLPPTTPTEGSNNEGNNSKSIAIAGLIFALFAFLACLYIIFAMVPRVENEVSKLNAKAEMHAGISGSASGVPQAGLDDDAENRSLAAV